MHLPDRILNRNLRPFIESACAVLAQIPAGQSPAQLQIRVEKHNPPQMRCICGGLWPTRQDSNLRPQESESCALSSWATGRYHWLRTAFIIAHFSPDCKHFLRFFRMLCRFFIRHIDKPPVLVYNSSIGMLKYRKDEENCDVKKYPRTVRLHGL